MYRDDAHGRCLARRIRPARERSARSGIHQGPTPLGYTRVYPPPSGRARHEPGLLVPDAVYAPVVQEIFTRYAAGGWSYLSLVDWLNGDPQVPPPPSGAGWTSAAIREVLRNPVYCGLVRYNRRPEGRYERAAPGSEFVEPGRHPALIDCATFDRVAARRAAAATRSGYRRHAPALGTGIFVCTACGGPMTASHQGPRMLYRCSWAQRRKGPHHPVHGVHSFAGEIADEALLREIRRLHTNPWALAGALQVGDLRPATPGVPRDPAATEGPRPAAQTALACARPAYPDCGRDLPGGSEQGVAPFDVSAAADRLKDLHARIAQVACSRSIDPQGTSTTLRQLLLDLVASARIVDRVPEHRPRWLRAGAIWQPDVQVLLDAGVLWLDPPEPAPVDPLRAERHREAQRRYAARRRRAVPSSGLRPSPCKS